MSDFIIGLLVGSLSTGAGIFSFIWASFRAGLITYNPPKED